MYFPLSSYSARVFRARQHRKVGQFARELSLELFPIEFDVPLHLEEKPFFGRVFLKSQSPRLIL
jgi:hypothetical protein